MEPLSREAQRAQEISPKFNYLTQLVYLCSGASAAIGITASVLMGNVSIAIAGIGSASISLYALAPSRNRASHTAATLLIRYEEEWERKISDIQVQSRSQVAALTKEREALSSDRLTQSQRIKSLVAQTSQLEHEKQAIEQRLTQAQAAFDRAQVTMQEHRHELAVHLEAIEGQILDVWNPLYAGLMAICDRFDPTRPVSELEYAGKPVTLDEAEKQKWTHYRDSLTHYDDRLRDPAGLRRNIESAA